MGTDLQMKDFVVNLLGNGLAQRYAYHHVGHTLYVYDKAIEIAQHEACTSPELNLIKTAALWHDTGFINTYLGHEDESCVLARKHVPQYGFSPAAIDTICEMIMATKIPQTPKNKLGEIIADADLEYLGTTDAALQAGNLYKELQSMNPALTKAAWNDMQISFLKNHHYFTSYCIKNREPAKQAYLDNLIKGNCGSMVSAY